MINHYFLSDSFDARQRPKWVYQYLSLSGLLSKLQHIRMLSLKMTSEGLLSLAAFAKDPDWKVRLEVVKAVYRLLHIRDITRQQAISVLKPLHTDPNPMVEIWVNTLYKEY